MELFRALGTLTEAPDRHTERLTRLLGIPRAPTTAEYTELFILTLPPYASIYLGPEGQLGGEARDRIAGFTRALGDIPSAEPDHLAQMLAQYAALVAESVDNDARRDALSRARDAYLFEHLLTWLPPYLDKVIELGSPPFVAWGRLLEDALNAESQRLGLGIRGDVPLAMREDVPLVADPTLDEIIGFLLAPGRSGIFLTQADLTRAANALGLARRVGDRKFVLRNLLVQSANPMLAWLGVDATAWAERHVERRESLGRIAAAWERRARATTDVLRASAL
jgi:TorA maturation chaperone TorD